ncbi:hypothetical protein Vretimale_8193 [Volvox reticuliferus]|uniref:Uncharacterized protein n=1 Tax=Volvox reticuliferus TaxID=1737510 RepID=A0A8J4GB44_9CHLO|nr:hypothetical protein Vretimale_8193 [Volvox reticuliferus]
MTMPGNGTPVFNDANCDGTEQNDNDAGIKLELGGTQVEIQGLQNARLYHDEHFAHGIRVTADDTAAPSRKATGFLGLRSPTNLDPNPGLRNAGAVTLGTPMPKWPPGHQSAAFEAVAIKKSLILSPAEIYAECAHHGLGYTTCLLIGGNLKQAPGVGDNDQYNYGIFKLIYGAVGFPFGFTTIIVCGAELYTSLCAYMTAAWWEGKVDLLDVLRVLSTSWTGNFIGCALIAGLLKASEVFDHKDTTLLRQVEDKLSHGWGAVFVKGIFANWLVGIATWMANAAQVGAEDSTVGTGVGSGALHPGYVCRLLRRSANGGAV